MKSIQILAIAACFGLCVSMASPQSVLGKGRGQGQSQGQGQGRGQGGGQSTGGDLGKGRSDQGRGQSTGSGQGSGSSQGSGGLEKGRGERGRGQSTSSGQGSGGSQGSGGLEKGRGERGNGQSSGGDLGRSTGGGQSSGGLGKGRSDQGRTTGGNEQSRGTGSGSGSLGNLGRGNQGSGTGTGRGTGNELGRINDTGNRVNSLGRGQDRGRLGNTNYGSSHNLGRQGGNQTIEQIRFSLNKGSLQLQVSRSETVRVRNGYSNGYNNGYREGYCSYSDNWRDDSFYYPFYIFSPFGNRCSVSPWYYYGHMPGYINSNRIHYYSNTSCNWGYGQNYSWDRFNSWDDRRYRSDLDESIDDLVASFERGDRRALGRLISNRGYVNVYMDDQYTYSLDGDDFYDLMLDNIQCTRTVRYSIDRVRTSRDEVQVSATHEFIDTWGRRQCVYHNYRLEQERSGYVITDFRSSYRP